MKYICITDHMAANIKHLKMKSRITIEVDFDNGNQPEIVLNLHKSDDVRDKLLASFIEKFAHQRAWCKAFYGGNTENGQIWHIVPIEPKDHNEEGRLMLGINDVKPPLEEKCAQSEKRNKPHVDVNGTPRRNKLNKLTTAEIKLYDIMQDIERIGAHPLLTEVINAISEARERLADWVELPNTISHE